MNTQKLRVMVWNLENFFIFMEKFQTQGPKRSDPLDEMSEFDWQHLPSGIMYNKNLSHVLKIRNIINKYLPDVLMLTEVGGKLSLDNFTHHFLLDKYVVFHKDSNSDRGIDLGYLVKKELAPYCQLTSYRKYPINFLYPHELKIKKKVTPKNSHKFSRDCLHLNLNLKGVGIGFLLVHLKSKLDKNKIDPMGYLRREAECKAMLEIYQTLYSKFKILMIGGDLNGFAQRVDTDVEFNHIYNQTDLDDVLELASRPDTERFTHVHEKPSGEIYSTQLDYLFVDKKHKQILENAWVDYFHDFINVEPTPKNLRKFRSLLPSDHFPIVADFSVPLK